METLISSSHSKHILDYSQPILLIYVSGRLMWILISKNNPSKTLYSYDLLERDLLDLL
jgi:hypothetical protein